MPSVFEMRILQEMQATILRKILKKGILHQFVAGCDRFKEGFVLAMKELVEAWSLPKKTVAIIIRYHVWQKPPPTGSDENFGNYLAFF